MAEDHASSANGQRDVTATIGPGIFRRWSMDAGFTRSPPKPTSRSEMLIGRSARASDRGRGCLEAASPTRRSKRKEASSPPHLVLEGQIFIQWRVKRTIGLLNSDLFVHFCPALPCLLALSLGIQCASVLSTSPLCALFLAVLVWLPFDSSKSDLSSLLSLFLLHSIVCSPSPEARQTRQKRTLHRHGPSQRQSGLLSPPGHRRAAFVLVRLPQANQAGIGSRERRRKCSWNLCPAAHQDRVRRLQRRLACRC